MSKLTLKIILIFTSLIVVGLLVLAVESASTDDSITVDVGTLPAGKSVTIVFEVTVDEPFPVGVLEVCNQGTVSGDNFSDVLTDDPSEPGSDDRTCTTLDNVGQIIIVKDANLEDDTEFDFDGGSLGAFTLKDPSDDTETFADQAPGTYVFTETVPVDWDLDDITCLTNDQTDTTVTDTVNSKVTIDLDAHETITCTFSNVERGRVLVDKVTNPSDDPTSFNFTLTGGPSSLNQSFSLTDAAAPHDSGPVLPGSGYTVSETVPSDWDLTTFCSDGSLMDNIDLGPGEIVTCTFTNTLQTGTIIIEKQTDPAGGAGFQFTNDIPGGPTPFNLNDGGNQLFNDVSPGTYTVTETDPKATPGGYTLANLNCVETGASNSVEIVGTRTATINLEAGETVTCTFTNEAGFDTDGDGVPDSVEGSGDRDGDGIPDDEDYDPTGYFYDETTGQIIAGGQIAVTGPGAVNVVHDGSDGFYQFTTDGTAGTYTMQVTLPPGYGWSDTCLRQDPPPFDPTGGVNPTVLGNGEDGDTGFLTSSACTPYYLTFDLAAGDPVIFNNNFPIGELFILTVNVAGGESRTMTGNVTAGWSGTVTSDPAGILCGTDCTESYLDGTLVTLAAHPGVKTYLASWGGDCDTNGQVTMDADKHCTATFGYPVGGIVVPVNKLGLVALRLSSGQAPWMGLAALVGLAVLGVVVVRKRRG